MKVLYIAILKISINYCFIWLPGIGVGLNISWFLQQTISLMPNAKLERAIEIMTQATEIDLAFTHINEVLLNKIVINEYSKSYLTKEVDQENKEGYFVIYKRLVNRMSQMINEVNADYPYSSSLASTIIEGALHQYFLMDHFSSLTSCNKTITPTEYFKHLAFNTLNIKNNG